MLAVSTIGNATLVAYEDRPILATDPWLGDPAYFGSWGLSHEIPSRIKDDILSTKYIWFSHGHPDHLNPESLAQLAGKNVLIADHVGARIAHDLREQGFSVTILPDRKWINLSPHIRAFCISTMIQDSVLLLDVGGRLFINLNDAGPRDCKLLIRKIASQYRHAYVMQLSGYGDADMINFYDESGAFIPPAAAHKPPVGRGLSSIAMTLGVRNVIPFSSFHAYRRTDSAWAQKYTTPLDAYETGFDHTQANYIPPFSHIDCTSGATAPLRPKPLDSVIQAPEIFGDVWSDQLDRADLEKCRSYFRRRELVRDYLSFINLRVGRRDNFVDLDGSKKRGITFEVPRHSLMKAIEYEVFDDLLIGNFMKTTLHGMGSLYDGSFNFAVTKFGDNGRAFTRREVNHYLREYKRRAGVDWYHARLYDGIINRVGVMTYTLVPKSSPVYTLAQHVHRMLTTHRH